MILKYVSRNKDKMSQQAIVIRTGPNHQKHRDSITLFGFIIRVVVISLLIIIILVILRSPQSPLKNVINPKTVPKVPGVPDSNKESIISTEIILLFVGLILVLVMAYNSDYISSHFLSKFSEPPKNNLSSQTQKGNTQQLNTSQNTPTNEEMIRKKLASELGDPNLYVTEKVRDIEDIYEQLKVGGKISEGIYENVQKIMNENENNYDKLVKLAQDINSGKVKQMQIAEENNLRRKLKIKSE